MTNNKITLEESLYSNKGLGKFLKRVLYINFVPRCFKKKEKEFYKKDFIDQVSGSIEIVAGLSISINSSGSSLSDTKILPYLGLYLGIDGLYRLAGLYSGQKSGRGPATLAADLVWYPVYRLHQTIKKQII